jgi:hypothetical protein
MVMFLYLDVLGMYLTYYVYKVEMKDVTARMHGVENFKIIQTIKSQLLFFFTFSV